MQQKALKLQTYATENGYNTELSILIDMSVFSGNTRLFVWDHSKGEAIHTGLVSHGHCQKNVTEVEFSNVEGSNCSSEGRYAIDFKYTGQFGESYKLIGLDSTNDQAFNRYIVFHSHECVPDDEQTLPICPSEGCPTVSPTLLDDLKPIIDASTKPILMWIYKGEDV